MYFLQEGERIMNKCCCCEDIVKLWVETQMGCMHKCKEKQFEFADMMWELYNKQQQNKGETDNG